MANKNFKDIFLKQLITEDQDGSLDFNDGDDEAWKQSLDSETNPSDFDSPDNPRPKISKQNVEVAKEWVTRIDEFAKFLNGVEDDSLHAQIANMDREGSVFRGIIKSERKKITKIAEQLQSVKEVLKGYIINSDRMVRELNSQGR